MHRHKCEGGSERGNSKTEKYEVESLSNRPYDEGDDVETRLKFYSMVVLDAQHECMTDWGQEECSYY